MKEIGRGKSSPALCLKTAFFGKENSEIVISGFHFFVADGQVLQGKSFKWSWMIDGIVPMMCLINLVCFCPLAHGFTCR